MKKIIDIEIPHVYIPVSNSALVGSYLVQNYDGLLYFSLVLVLLFHHGFVAFCGKVRVHGFVQNAGVLPQNVTNP